MKNKDTITRPADAEEQHCLGIMYEHGLLGSTQDLDQAFKWYTKAAVQGNPTAQYDLGIMYADGIGVPQDYALAIEWFTKSAEQGDLDAQVILGIRYENGVGVPQDYKQAAKWYTKATEQGHSLAQSYLDDISAQVR